jgi:signal transduction histidine kinase
MGSRPSEIDASLNERVVASAAHGVLVLDGQGRVRAANPAARTLLGLATAPVGAALGQLPALKAVAERAQASPANGTAEVRVIVDGVARSLVVQWAPLGNGEGTVVTVLDLTALREAEAAQRRRDALAGVARLTNHVAHELKNPLGALKLYALLLERQLRDTKPDGRELAEKIARAVDHLSTLVSEVGSFLQPGRPDLAPTSLGEVVEAALAAVTERAQATGIEIVRRLAAGSAALPADPRALREAVLAFVRNAVEAMPEGGTLTVELSEAGPEALALAIQDTGPGIAPELQSRLFEPFFTTKREGIGLGMTVAHQVVEQHGGQVEVCSQPGAGTTVRVVLPARGQAESHGTHPRR